ncbi:MAG: cation-translocating P-type ATPase [Anaeroplasma sp.]|uniref:cation-translocating P-type ATPase n=1 Tax=Anaeroplasma sp. TaxID=1872523 RepID=UPI002A91B685|nr:cation-translocating P-type ATPase [Anaeroplasma sp.]MDY5982782.1 cation-translocating P-type ATPase [Anaeroplasma sp.]
MGEVKAYECLNKEEVIKDLGTNREMGLSLAEAEKRLNEYGENILKEKKKDGPFKIFLSQLMDPMIYVLFAAIAVTVGVSIYETIKVIKEGGSFDFFSTGDWPDVIIILIVILMNAFIGTIQELKAQTSLEALKKMSSPESTVIRDGKRIKVKSSNLVPGDVVIIEEGDTIGADLRLIEAVNLKVNESSLTGESVPVEKDSNVVFTDKVALGDKVNSCFMSTTVAYGRGIGVVARTGMNTEIGKIAEGLNGDKEEMTPLQKVLANLSKILGFITLAVVLLVFIVEIIWIFVDGKGSVVDAYIEAILSAISLAVAAIPEGLAAVVTIVLSLGVQRMVKANTIVRKLPSVETLGSVSVVCSDKTGTLTQNKMTVLEAYVPGKLYVREDFKEGHKDFNLTLLATGMSLCSNATVDEGLYGDPTEIALVVFANDFNLHKKNLEESYPRVEELPFDSVRKLMSTRHEHEGKSIVFTKGALDSITKRATKILDNGKEREIRDNDIKAIYEKNQYFADKALRVLALAYRYKDDIEEADLCFVGMVAMIDPARPEAKDAVAKFKTAGITTVMITGDHKDTAFAIAKELGIASDIRECHTGEDVDNMSEEELRECVKTARVFARVSPENKVSIVKAFKANGHIAAMTGDGVNDAPSLKAADIGIAMGITGTDVAKGAADMVLTDDNFASIEKAVEEGRCIYSNIRKTVLFLLSSNIAEVILMLVLIMIGMPLPLIAIHLLWVNLVTDSLPAVALGMQPKEQGLMNEKPRDPHEGIFANGGMLITLLYGAILSISVILAYFVPAWMHMDEVNAIGGIKQFYEANPGILDQARTMAFVTLAFSELTHMIGMSDVKHSFIHIFKDKNWMMALAFALGIALQIVVVMVPGINSIFKTSWLSLMEWFITIGLCLIPIVIHEFLVLVWHKHTRNK